jgi:hypothetical protein
MGKLIYSMLTSLDGYTEDEHVRFGWGAPEGTPRDEFQMIVCPAVIGRGKRS